MLAKISTNTKRQTHRVRSTIGTAANLFPGRASSLEVTECLRKLKRLVHDALLLLIVSNLGVTGQWEVLAKRMAVESIIGQHTAEIGMAGEEDTKHVVHFTFVPESAVEEAGHTGYGLCLVAVRLDADTRVVADTEHVVDNLESLVAGGIVDRSYIGDLGVLGGGMVLEEGHDGDQAGWGNVDGELVLPDGELLDVFGKTGHDVLSVFVHGVGLVLVFVGRIDHGSAQFSLSYTSSNI